MGRTYMVAVTGCGMLPDSSLSSRFPSRLDLLNGRGPTGCRVLPDSFFHLYF
jgi:hypothetical protein